MKTFAFTLLAFLALSCLALTPAPPLDARLPQGGECIGCTVIPADPSVSSGGGVILQDFTSTPTNGRCRQYAVSCEQHTACHVSISFTVMATSSFYISSTRSSTGGWVDPDPVYIYSGPVGGDPQNPLHYLTYNVNPWIPCGQDFTESIVGTFSWPGMSLSISVSAECASCWFL